MARGRILYVDDCKDSRRLISRLLAMEGYEVLTAATYAEAIGLAQVERIDLLVADLGLPDKSGMSLLSEVRKLQPAKGIVLSGFDNGDESIDAGYSAHVLKPVVLPQLCAKIAEILVT